MKKEKKKQRNEVLWKYLEINFMLIYCYYYCYVKFLINFIIKSFHVYLHVKSHFVNQLFEFVQYFACLDLLLHLNMFLSI